MFSGKQNINFMNVENISTFDSHTAFQFPLMSNSMHLEDFESEFIPRRILAANEHQNISGLHLYKCQFGCT